MEEERIERALSSIKVSQNFKKEYGFEVKCYYAEEERPEAIVARIDSIYTDLHSRFK